MKHLAVILTLIIGTPSIADAKTTNLVCTGTSEWLDAELGLLEPKSKMVDQIIIYSQGGSPFKISGFEKHSCKYRDNLLFCSTVRFDGLDNVSGRHTDTVRVNSVSGIYDRLLDYSENKKKLSSGTCKKVKKKLF